MWDTNICALSVTLKFSFLFFSKPYPSNSVPCNVRKDNLIHVSGNHSIPRRILTLTWQTETNPNQLLLSIYRTSFSSPYSSIKNPTFASPYLPLLHGIGFRCHHVEAGGRLQPTLRGPGYLLSATQVACSRGGGDTARRPAPGPGTIIVGEGKGTGRAGGGRNGGRPSDPGRGRGGAARHLAVAEELPP